MTGGSIVHGLLAKGYHVVTTSRSLARLEAAFSEVGAEHSRLSFVACDLSTDVGIAEGTRDLLGPSGLKLLVNNAGSGVLARNISGGGEGALMEAYDATMALDLRAPYKLTALSVPMLEASGAGVIINISSLAAVRPLARLSAYCIAKAGVEMLTKCSVHPIGRVGSAPDAHR